MPERLQDCFVRRIEVYPRLLAPVPANRVHRFTIDIDEDEHHALLSRNPLRSIMGRELKAARRVPAVVSPPPAK
jgi:hypothetical protein